eukprot:8426828-Alexandrium_andersonii.AAC.1
MEAFVLIPCQLGVPRSRRRRYAVLFHAQAMPFRGNQQEFDMASNSSSELKRGVFFNAGPAI